MTTDQIDKTIEQCVCHSTISTSRDQLRALVRMAVEAEREECAALAWSTGMDLDSPIRASRPRDIGSCIATAIRNRKEAE